MSKFPVYRIGTKDWDDFGSDGFNQYGYNEQGYDKNGKRHIVLASKCPWWFAQDDSFDAIVGDRKEIARCGVSGDWVTDFFFVPESGEPYYERHPLNSYICYSQAAADAVRARDWPLGVNYRLMAGLDGDFDFI